jgi:hypothetical protein
VGQAATSLTLGCTFVLAETTWGGDTLIALRPEGEGLAEAWRQQVGSGVFLAQDAASRHVLAFTNDGEDGRWVWLSAKAPGDAMRASAPPEQPPALDPHQVCAWTGGSLGERIRAYEALLPLVDAEAATARARALVAGPLDLVTGAALWFVAPEALRSGILQRLRELHGSAPEVRLIAAETFVHDGRHRDALAALADLEPGTLAPAMARHVGHLRAICRLRLGEEAEARAALEPVMLLAPDACALEPLADWIDALRAPLEELAGTVGPTRRGLVARLRQADAALAAGDVEGARARLDHAAVWAFSDVQTIGRLAETYLRLAPGDPALRLRQHYVMAYFRELMAQPLPRQRLCFGREDWEVARLQEVAERARRWLGDPPAQAAPARTPPEPGPRVGAGGGGSRLVVTEVAGDSRTPGVRLRNAGSEQALLRHEEDLRAQAREVRRVRGDVGLVGLVLDPALPAAEHLQAAREHLRGTRGAGPETAVVVPLEVTNRLLTAWPHLFDDFLAFHAGSSLRGDLSILLVRPDGAGWRQVPM